MNDTTLDHLNELKRLLKENQHLFNQNKLSDALQGKLPHLPILKRDISTPKGHALNILNTANQCFKRFNGSENRLIKTACIVTISTIEDLTLDWEATCESN